MPLDKICRDDLYPNQSGGQHKRRIANAVSVLGLVLRHEYDREQPEHVNITEKGVVYYSRNPNAPKHVLKQIYELAGRNL